MNSEGKGSLIVQLMKAFRRFDSIGQLFKSFKEKYSFQKPLL